MNRSPLIISSLSRATLFVLLLTAQSAMAGSEGATGMIASIDKAPISMDGNLKGKATDFVITLRPPVEPRNMADAGGMTGAGGTRFQGSLLDPKVAGRGLKEGATIKVILPDNFDLSDLGDFPVAGVFSGDDCAPGNLLCTTGILLQGWPQNPIPPPPNYALSIEGNAIIFTAYYWRCIQARAIHQDYIMARRTSRRINKKLAHILAILAQTSVGVTQPPDLNVIQRHTFSAPE